MKAPRPLAILGLLSLALVAAAAPLYPRNYTPLPAWAPSHPTLPAPHAPHTHAPSLPPPPPPSWLAAYLAALLPHESYSPHARPSAASVASAPPPLLHRSVWADLRALAERAYDALSDQRTYAAVMLAVALLNFVSIVVVLLFFRAQRERDDAERAACACACRAEVCAPEKRSAETETETETGE